MRHRKLGRRLGRTSSHRKALMRNMASSLLLSERSEELNEAGYEYDQHDDTPAAGRNIPKVKGRIVTTLAKAKTLRPYIERCITIARKALPHMREADKLTISAEQYAVTSSGSPDEAQRKEYREWRNSDKWVAWNQAMAPALAARRRVATMLGNQRAAEILFDDVAPRFEDRDGGYTRVLRLAFPRLGDAGTRAILEFVGNDRDRVKQESERPAFEDEASSASVETPSEEPAAEEAGESSEE
ncbi:MAG: bL17 family ribosomal protein [Pirellulales bacterium]|jgi:large subunit ribosomal protein L17